MKWYYNFSKKIKLLFTFYTVTIITLVVDYVGYKGIKNISKNQNSIYHNRFIPIQDLGNASTPLLTARENVAAMFGTIDLNKRKIYQTYLEQSVNKLLEKLNMFSEGVLKVGVEKKKMMKSES